MEVKTFKKGMRVPHNKHAGAGALADCPAPSTVYIPLAQHIGKPATAAVEPGARVRAGTRIGAADGFVSANIFSSVSGTVKAIAKRRTPTGSCNHVVIENDGLYETESLPKLVDRSRESLLARIKDAGLVGMGGAGFPTFIKLSPKEPDKIDYIIANCAECEPYLTSDYRRMIEEPEKLIGGLKIMLRLFDHAKGILAVEENKPDAIALLKKLTKDEPDIMVTPLKTKYPQGSERSIIYATTGRAINSSMLPADAGCIVDNVDTIVAVYHAVTDGKPLMYRIVTVTGDAVRDPRNFIVRIGTMYDELIEEAGGFVQEPAKVVSGGPMMGFGMFDLHVPTTKTASALLCLTKDDVSEMEPTACIKCGRCVEVCPQRLVPNKLMVASIHDDAEAFLRLNGLECVECGCCSYTCPAKRPLTQTIKSMRKIELAKKKK